MNSPQDSQGSCIFAIKPTQTNDQVSFQRVWSQAKNGGLATAHYSSIVPIRVGGNLFLCAYDKALQRTDLYMLSAGEPWLQVVASQIQLVGGPWDMMDTFVLGNDPYLLTYRGDNGTFGFFRLKSDFSVSPPYNTLSGRK